MSRFPAAKEHFATNPVRLSDATSSSLTAPSRLPPPAGQPFLLAGCKVRRGGPQCEVASQLCARCEALAAPQPELTRLNAYNAMIMEVGDVRDDEKGCASSMPVAQLVLLPDTARMDMRCGTHRLVARRIGQEGLAALLLVGEYQSPAWTPMIIGCNKRQHITPMVDQ